MFQEPSTIPASGIFLPEWDSMCSAYDPAADRKKYLWQKRHDNGKYRNGKYRVGHSMRRRKLLWGSVCLRAPV
jgi:hypothetical protein